MEEKSSTMEQHFDINHLFEAGEVDVPLEPFIRRMIDYTKLSEDDCYKFTSTMKTQDDHISKELFERLLAYYQPFNGNHPGGYSYQDVLDMHKTPGFICFSTWKDASAQLKNCNGPAFESTRLHYLVRYSSQKGHYAMSFIDKNGIVDHDLISHIENTTRYKDREGREYNSVMEVVQTLAKELGLVGPCNGTHIVVKHYQ